MLVNFQWVFNRQNLRTQKNKKHFFKKEILLIILN